VVQHHGKTLIASGGLRTGLLPLRLFIQPETRLMEKRPPQR
jgi:predicted MPP superfamily phosphohydrolase